MCHSIADCASPSVCDPTEFSCRSSCPGGGDGVKNGDETDVDCGGDSQLCQRCGEAQTCVATSDCAEALFCDETSCAACDPSCAECNGATSSDCTACHPHATLSGGVCYGVQPPEAEFRGDISGQETSAPSTPEETGATSTPEETGATSTPVQTVDDCPPNAILIVIAIVPWGIIVYLCCAWAPKRTRGSKDEPEPKEGSEEEVPGDEDSSVPYRRSQEKAVCLPCCCAGRQRKPAGSDDGQASDSSSSDDDEEVMNLEGLIANGEKTTEAILNRGGILQQRETGSPSPAPAVARSAWASSDRRDATSRARRLSRDPLNSYGSLESSA